MGGAGITGFKCVVQGIKDQAATESFFQTCWAAAKIEGADIALGSQWVTEAVDAIYNPVNDADFNRHAEIVCPAELTMLSVGSSDAAPWLTFNILPSATKCDSATSD
ncbi:hypothetical protein [Glycomyces sp. YM15]|uniref:hypothetical protein n=1 Tax=Glycomyces sp. YM15 TaxID=2800446 RepID=UPI0019638F22|nr:hypothetical protein [Glycomyces sp. YM15]